MYVLMKGQSWKVKVRQMRGKFSVKWVRLYLLKKKGIARTEESQELFRNCIAINNKEVQHEKVNDSDLYCCLCY